MADHLTPERRSWNMSRIRNKNTKPEIRVRSLLHGLSYYFTVKGSQCEVALQYIGLKNNFCDI
ncbi:very short patch repair endonuclease [Verrucomicrobiales bacterium]|nr:very short patch repair endonuclease [Verrucomicrobiales bacterium]